MTRPADRAPRLARCPATRTCSAPSRSTSPTTCWPTCGCSRATGPLRRALAAADVLPLGAGALAGSTSTPTASWWPRSSASPPCANSIDAVSNRDFVLDYLCAAATCAAHLSRLGAEIVLWSSDEFGFCEVSDAWAPGRPIMPQKKNPDVAELCAPRRRA